MIKLVLKVRWKGYDKDQDTWEPQSNLDNCQQAIDDYWARRNAEKEKKKQEEAAAASGGSTAAAAVPPPAGIISLLCLLKSIIARYICRNELARSC